MRTYRPRGWLVGCVLNMSAQPYQLPITHNQVNPGGALFNSRLQEPASWQLLDLEGEDNGPSSFKRFAASNKLCIYIILSTIPPARARFICDYHESLEP